jgi:predicted transcriptional regulator of viral defense system
MSRQYVTQKKQAKPGKDRVLELARKAGVLRPRDLDAEGIPREYLRRLLIEGLLDRPGRGIYIAAGLTKSTPNHSLAEACKRVPHGVVCLLSALQFHELTTQAPFEVWLAIGEKARLPKVDYPPLRIVRFSGSAMESGIKEHSIEGVGVKVYSPAKTVADCFKYRNKIGLDVALEALRDCWKKRRATMDELWHAAKMCRVANVMRPYLESVT